MEEEKGRETAIDASDEKRHETSLAEASDEEEVPVCEECGTEYTVCSREGKFCWCTKRKLWGFRAQCLHCLLYVEGIEYNDQWKTFREVAEDVCLEVIKKGYQHAILGVQLQTFQTEQPDTRTIQRLYANGYAMGTVE